MFEKDVVAFVEDVASLGPQEPPGSIAVGALALAGAVALVEKSATAHLTAELPALRRDLFALARRDADEYRRWRAGARDSKALEEYPARLAHLARHVADIAASAVPSPAAGETDLVAAAALARGVAACAEAVVAGNLRTQEDTDGRS